MGRGRVIALGVVSLSAVLQTTRHRRAHQARAVLPPGAVRVSLPGPAGRLSAWWLDATDADEHGTVSTPMVLAVHGYASSGEDLMPIAPDLAAAGYIVMALDLRGHGDSDRGEGRPTPPDLAADVHAAVDWLRHCNSDGPIVLLGHSMGGSTVVQVASDRHDIAAVVTVAAVADPTLTRIGFWPAFVSRGLLATMARRRNVDPSHTFAVNRLGHVRAPVLLVHGTADQIVPIRHLDAFLAEVPATRSLRIDGAGHRSIDRYRGAIPAILDFLASPSVILG